MADEQQIIHLGFCHHDFPVLQTRILGLIFDTSFSLIPTLPKCSCDHQDLSFLSTKIPFISATFSPTPFILIQVTNSSQQHPSNWFAHTDSIFYTRARVIFSK